MRTLAYFEEGGRQETPVWTLDQLAPGHRVAGPALLIDDISTIVVEPSCEAEVRLGGLSRNFVAPRLCALSW